MPASRRVSNFALAVVVVAGALVFTPISACSAQGSKGQVLANGTTAAEGQEKSDSQSLSRKNLFTRLRIGDPRGKVADTGRDGDAGHQSILGGFLDNLRHNMFKPLLLFFYLGFLFPILKVQFEFPYTIYQGLTIYLLIAIGWHGGEELANLPASSLAQAVGFMFVGFCLNFVIGMLAFFGLSAFTNLRRIDKATVAGYYGSDSAGTFVTCVGALTTAGITFQAYMPVMLAVMEIPGCLVALFLVSRLRRTGMDPLGNMPGEPGYDPNARPVVAPVDPHGHQTPDSGVEAEKKLSLEKTEHNGLNDNLAHGAKSHGFLTPQMLHEVFLNPGLCLLFGGILIGFVSGLQGTAVTRADDNFFVTLFHGILCLFLMEMGMTASRKIRDLKSAGIGYVLFALIAPNIFAVLGIAVAHIYATLTHTDLDLGTYVLFSVLCAAASYIAVPAVQRLAIPEASPTLPLAASLGLTFTYNVTIGIPIYIEVARFVMRTFPY
ncbi:MAG: sodium-dependent bicarbonate transport family permease [Isosphaeraceae bacterium]